MKTNVQSRTQKIIAFEHDQTVQKRTKDKHTHTHIYVYIYICIHTGCFTTLGHKCRR